MGSILAPTYKLHSYCFEEKLRIVVILEFEGCGLKYLGSIRLDGLEGNNFLQKELAKYL